MTLLPHSLWQCPITPAKSTMVAVATCACCPLGVVTNVPAPPTSIWVVMAVPVYLTAQQAR